MVQTQGHLTFQQNSSTQRWASPAYRKRDATQRGLRSQGSHQKLSLGGTAPQDPTPSPGEMASLRGRSLQRWGAHPTGQGGEPPSSPNCPGRKSRQRRTRSLEKSAPTVEKEKGASGRVLSPRTLHGDRSILYLMLSVNVAGATQNTATGFAT